MLTTRIGTLGSLVVTAAVIGGCLGGADSDKAGGERKPAAVVLTLGNHEASSNDVDAFAGELARRSGGSMRIDFKNHWREGEIDYERRTLQDVREGKVDLAKVGARAFDLFGVKSLQPLVAPFAVDSYALEGRVLRDPVAGRMLRGVRRLHMVGIALLPGELRKPLGVSRALVGASDYRGATIGTRPSELGARTLRALGATPESYDPAGAISGFDGIEAGMAAIEAHRHDAAGRAVAANVNLWPRALAIVMNQDAYEALSDDQRAALEAAGRAAVDPSLAELNAREDQAVSVLCRRGELALRSASNAQLQGLRAATRTGAGALERDPATRDAVRAIAALRSEVDPEPAPTCAADGLREATRPRAPLDGVWRMDTTARELARIAPPGDVVPENWGRHTFVLQSGRIAYTQENRDACTWGYGRYAVKGDVVEWTMEDGGGISPNNFVNRPGEFFRFRWSRYRDRLTLTPVKGAVSPEPFRVESWRLLEREASPAALSARCRPPHAALQP